MKNLLFGLIATIVFVFSTNAQTSRSLKPDVFFDLVISKSVEVKGENVLFVTYDFNTKDKTYSNYSFEIKEPKFFVIDFTTSGKKSYTVTCMKGTTTLWTENCDGKFSCGGMIYDCLNAGGCATICNNNKMAYLPQTKDLILLNE